LCGPKQRNFPPFPLSGCCSETEVSEQLYLVFQAFIIRFILYLFTTVTQRAKKYKASGLLIRERFRAALGAACEKTGFRPYL
jgi:hypothetical protein